MHTEFVNVPKWLWSCKTLAVVQVSPVQSSHWRPAIFRPFAGTPNEWGRGRGEPVQPFRDTSGQHWQQFFKNSIFFFKWRTFGDLSKPIFLTKRYAGNFRGHTEENNKRKIPPLSLRGRLINFNNVRYFCLKPEWIGTHLTRKTFEFSGRQTKPQFFFKFNFLTLRFVWVMNFVDSIESLNLQFF